MAYPCELLAGSLRRVTVGAMVPHAVPLPPGVGSYQCALWHDAPRMT